MKKILIGIIIIIAISLGVFFIQDEKEFNITFNNTSVNIPDNVILKDNVIYISQGGKYILSGLAKDYEVKIDTDKSVTLVLDNLSLERDKDAINILNAKDITIEVIGDNTISSIEGVGIYSKSDINIKGTGKLNIDAYEGIKTDGELQVEEVKLNINSTSDAIEAKVLGLNKVDIKIKTNGTYIEDNESGRYAFINNRYIKVAKSDLEEYNKLYSLVVSSKGMNIEETLNVIESNLDIDSIDDAINAKKTINMHKTNGIMNTNDDAISSDTEIVLDECNIDIKACYEGIEAEYITIKSSNLNISGDDDALNIVSDEEKGELFVDKSNINIDVNGDALDIMGKIDIANSSMYMKAGDNGIQSREFSVNNSKIEVYSYNIETYAHITKPIILEGEIILAQNSDKFFLATNYQKTLEATKTPYAIINNLNSFKIVDENNNVIFETNNKEPECKNYIYINNKIQKDVTYYLVTENTKEILEFNNVK
ncbi:MAG: carbohydrate-binding domain-containing protein [Clostridia bacterium]|nr:carbohydrate-binding domain-containing protein [Clostridia bacterium]